MVEISRQRSKHTVERRCTHNTVIDTKRIGDFYRPAKFAILRKQQLIKNFRTLKGICHALGKSKLLDYISCYLTNTRLIGHPALRCLAARQRRRNLIISIKTGYFLCEVSQTEHILSPRRNLHNFFLSVRHKVDHTPVLAHLLFRNVNTEKRIDFVHIIRHAERLSFIWIHIDTTANDLTRAKFFN